MTVSRTSRADDVLLPREQRVRMKSMTLIVVIALCVAGSCTSKQARPITALSAPVGLRGVSSADDPSGDVVVMKNDAPNGFVVVKGVRPDRFVDLARVSLAADGRFLTITLTFVKPVPPTDSDHTLSCEVDLNSVGSRGFQLVDIFRPPKGKGQDLWGLRSRDPPVSNPIRIAGRKIFARIPLDQLTGLARRFSWSVSCARFETKGDEFSRDLVPSTSRVFDGS